MQIVSAVEFVLLIAKPHFNVDNMTLSEILPTIQSLPRAEKLRLIQLLAADVARDDVIVLDVASKTVPIRSPHNSFEGAATLLRVLDDDKVAP